MMSSEEEEDAQKSQLGAYREASKSITDTFNGDKNWFLGSKILDITMVCGLPKLNVTEKKNLILQDLINPMVF